MKLLKKSQILEVVQIISFNTHSKSVSLEKLKTLIQNLLKRTCKPILPKTPPKSTSIHKKPKKFDITPAEKKEKKKKSPLSTTPVHHRHSDQVPKAKNYSNFHFVRGREGTSLSRQSAVPRDISRGHELYPLNLQLQRPADMRHTFCRKLASGILRP